MGLPTSYIRTHFLLWFCDKPESGWTFLAYTPESPVVVQLLHPSPFYLWVFSFSQFRNAGYNFSATLARDLPLLPACDSTEEAIRSSLQHSSIQSLLLYHYTNARYPTRIFLDRKFMRFLNMALTNTKVRYTRYCNIPRTFATYVRTYSF